MHINRNKILKWLLILLTLSMVWISFVYATPSQLTLKKIKNAEYYILFLQKNIKLINGKYEFRGKDYPDSFSIWPEDKAFGDLNNDGVKDAAVIIVSKGAGSGTFYELAAVINKDGNPYNIASVEIGDRVIIKSLIIKSGGVFLKLFTHGTNDAACCPTMKKLLDIN